MARFLCPACGAEVPFRTADGVTTTCGSCGNLLIRKDLTLESLGKVATLADDLTPLQIGAVGKYRGSGFTVVGRSRVDWAEGTWNEWFVAFDSGETGWLAESQGNWAMLKEVPSSSAPKLDPKALRPGTSIAIGKYTFEVEDAREAWVAGIQGELPKVVRPGKKYFSVDLTVPAGEGGVATASIGFPDTGPEVYVGEWVDFPEFHFAGLRVLDGW
ncbi:MAG: DUF4178 domain-containing protein [Bdellovibrionales bacterium]|nr:DUF4178 domain-containing protein [Bdellovibrionales bacterium]